VKPENTAFLEVHRGIWDTWQRAQFIQYIDESTKQGLLNVIREEFDAGYLINMWCGACVVEMIKYVYTQYDQWLDAQQKIKS